MIDSLNTRKGSATCWALGLVVVLLLGSVDSSGENLFGDKVVAKGKGVEVKHSQVEEAVIAFKAARVGAGERVSRDMEEEAEKTILDRLIASQLLLCRATEADKTVGKTIGDKLIEEAKTKVANEVAFKRQLIVLGLTLAQFEAQIQEQSLVKAVIERELKPSHVIADEQVLKFYNDNPDAFQLPEQLRGSHILFSFKDPVSKAELSPEVVALKKENAKKVLDRAKAGEDFSKLAKEFSDDRSPDHVGGEYFFVKGQMPPEFDAAAFTLKPDQVSDLVMTRFGYHIIKLHERIPPKKSDLTDSMKGKIRDKLQQIAIQKDLPQLIEKLKKEASITISLTDKQ